MKISGRLKRIAAAVSTAGVLSGAVIAASAGPASASIAKGHIQLCAQGNYRVKYQFPFHGGSEQGYLKRGHCLYHYLGRDSQGAVKVWGFWNSHPNQKFYIGARWYDGAVSGLGVGAAGSTTRPYLRTW